MIPPRVQEMLKSRELLQLWSPYSIVERVKLLEAKFSVKISPDTLWRFYRDNDIKSRTGMAVYRQEISNTVELRRKRLVFAKLIANLIAEHKPIIYQDETTFHSWLLKAKSWANKESPNLHARNNKRLGVTVFGAIGACLSRPVFKLGTSTNQAEFREFAREVKLAVLPVYQNRKPIFVYDGAKAHTTRESQRLLKQLFEPLQIPAYSCEFNCKSIFLL